MPSADSLFEPPLPSNELLWVRISQMPSSLDAPPIPLESFTLRMIRLALPPRSVFLRLHDRESLSLPSNYMFGPLDGFAILIRPLLTSVSLSKSLTKPFVSSRQAYRPPRVRIAAFTPHPPHLLRHPLMAMGFALSRKLAQMPQPSMRFVFLRSGFCLRLPSDLTSRQAPLPSANSFCHPDL